MRIRRATPADAVQIGRLLHALNREVGTRAPDPPALARRLGELLLDGDTEVLLAGSVPRGLAVVRLSKSLWSDARECRLAELYVAPERRRRGIGRALVLAAIDVARVAGADHIELHAAESDAATRALSESVGLRARERPDGSLSLHYARGL